MTSNEMPVNESPKPASLKGDTHNSNLVLTIYYHQNPQMPMQYYSQFEGQERTLVQQIQALVRLIIKQKDNARTMILYKNHKRGTGKNSDLPENEELVRISNGGKKIDFSNSALDDDGRIFLENLLKPLND